ncbi:DNA repair and recombination protein RAD5B [Histoplasma capsulatum H143]|uniref:DNA repair and recombination protein RAD5B n=1 Tax=Ajellomyces capsulatus (strain H143) TaxID=544712 RepID=C6HPS9_AJECH|nr:DNA repair and recombination protein RAD5B [Histoplasma capsulatum H143]
MEPQLSSAALKDAPEQILSVAASSIQLRVDALALISHDQPRKEARFGHSISPGDRIANSPQNLVSLGTGGGGTPTDEDDRGASELVDVSQSSQEDAYTTFQLYDTLSSKVVGLRYYTGHATIGECVTIKREPSNRYDKNAIRVDNVMGVQIGHLPRTIASKLAPYMDSRSLLIEGVLSGVKGFFDCPIELKLYGTSHPVQQLELMQKMERDRLPLKAIKRFRSGKANQSAAHPRKAANQGRSLVNGKGQQWQSSGDPTGYHWSKYNL